MKLYINDRIVDEKKALIPVSDRAFLYGDAVFETMRSYGGKVSFLGRHIERLNNSLNGLKINCRVSEKTISGKIIRLLKANKLADACIKIMVTRGDSQGGVAVTGKESPRIVITASASRFYPEKFYRDGMSAVVVNTMKVASVCLDSGFKTHNYLNNIAARLEASAKGADEAIMLNIKEYLCETSVGNLFFVKKGILYTPSLDCDILPGITREVVIDAAEKLGIKVKEGKYRIGSLNNAEECFMTNSIAEIMPITKIDGKKTGDGKPGTITQSLHKAYLDGLIFGF